MEIEKESKISIGQRGGARPGAGRKKGMPNRRTVETQAAVEASGQTPLEYMLSVMRGDGDKKMRLAAAQAAAPYVHPKLSSVEMNAKVEVRTLAQELADLNAHADADSC